MNRQTMKLLYATFLCAALMAAGCESGAAARREPAADTSFKYISYRDIPGVAEDDIPAIEALRDGSTRFVFGALPSTEAFLDESGKIQGFVAMLCEFLTQIFDIPFEPVFYEWDDLIAGLESGEIDFTGELTATEERRKTYFMTDPIALRTVKYFRLENSLPITEIASSRTLRYAFLDGVTTENDVRDASKHPFEVFHVNNYSEAFILLKEGAVDAFFEESSAEYAFDEYEGVVAKYFFPIIFSDISLTTQKPELEPVISVVQNILKSGGDRFIGEMYGLGYGAYKKHKLHKSLSEEERAYIRENPVIPILAEYDNYPISFYNHKEKQWQGVGFDVFKEAEALTGLSFEIINEHNTEWNELMGMLERGDGAIVTELIRTPDREGRFLWASTANAQDYYALLSKSDLRDINYNEIIYMKVGLGSADFAYTEMFRKWFPNHKNTVEFDGIISMFEALERGEIDLAMATKNMLLFMTNYHELPDFKVNILFDIPLESSFGFHIGDTLLLGIMDKALRLIDTEDIADRWLNRTYDYRAKLAEAKYPLLISIGGLLMCVLALVSVLMLKNRNAEKRLEREVRVRTAELEEANRAKSDFLAKMSHEIRTPMNAIIGMSELTLRKNIAPDVRDDVEAIKNAGSNLLAIINDILDLSKIESGKLEIVPEDYCVASMINDVTTIIKVKLTESPVRFDVNLGETIPSVLFGDVVKIRQALLNLLNNAVKFTKEGSITLTLNGNIIDDENVILTITVTDTGKGIREEDIEKLFGEFVQINTDRNRDDEGTGLGLAITKHLISAMNGNIGVVSEYGKGSAFTITLPQKIRAREPLPQTAQGDRAENAADTITFSAPDARVLIVDDIQTNLKVAEGLLSPYNMRIDTCLSGAEAIETVKNVRYDMILMDHMMPGMDGVEAVKRIRALSAEDGDRKYLSDTPIIALTANAVTGVKEMFLQNGFNDFLAKPIDTVKLNAMLQTWIPKEKQVAVVHTDTDDADKNSVGGCDTDMVIDGIDVKLGISRTGGTADRYAQTLAVFHRESAETIDTIKKSLDANDMPAYVTRVHGLKSAAANIGAVELSDSARKLEEAGKRGDLTFARENTPKLLTDLETLLPNIENAIRAAAKKRAKAEIDTEALKSALCAMKTAIDDFAPGAINAASKLLAQFEDADDADVDAKIKSIRRHVLNGEYEEASDIIERFL